MIHRVLFALLPLAALAGCGSPTHLQYDYSRCFTATLATQADLGRSSAADADYPLSGPEGIALRQRVVEEATDTESGEAEFINSFNVQ